MIKFQVILITVAIQVVRTKEPLDERERGE